MLNKVNTVWGGTMNKPKTLPKRKSQEMSTQPAKEMRKSPEIEIDTTHNMTIDPSPNYTGASTNDNDPQDIEDEEDETQDYRMDDYVQTPSSEINHPYTMLAPGRTITQPTKRIPSENKRRFNPFEKVQTGATVDIQDIYELNVDLLENWYLRKPEEVKSSVLLGRNFNEAVKETRRMGKNFMEFEGFTINVNENPDLIALGDLTRARFIALIH